MKATFFTIMLLAMAISTTGCATGMTTADRYTVSGAAIGTGIGAGVGAGVAAAFGVPPEKGAVVGGVIGALIGGKIGSNRGQAVEQQRASAAAYRALCEGRMTQERDAQYVNGRLVVDNLRVHSKSECPGTYGVAPPAPVPPPVVYQTGDGIHMVDPYK